MKKHQGGPWTADKKRVDEDRTSLRGQFRGNYEALATWSQMERREKQSERKKPGGKKKRHEQARLRELDQYRCGEKDERVTSSQKNKVAYIFLIDNKRGEPFLRGLAHRQR